MYRVYEESLVTCDNETYITYGIACDEYNVTISDITCNKRRLEEFVQIINDYELSPVHLMDVVEDNLNELI